MEYSSVLQLFKFQHARCKYAGRKCPLLKIPLNVLVQAEVMSTADGNFAANLQGAR